MRRRCENVDLVNASRPVFQLVHVCLNAANPPLDFFDLLAAKHHAI
jgi:hypothetical protein